MKSQTTFFDSDDQPAENWVWTVEVFYSSEMRDALGIDPRDAIKWRLAPRPNHFRREASAVARAEELSVEYKRGLELDLIEFRVVPKYIGYVPDQDEAWIS